MFQMTPGITSQNGEKLNIVQDGNRLTIGDSVRNAAEWRAKNLKKINLLGSDCSVWWVKQDQHI